MAGFNVISLKLKEMYQMITLGGDAELELVDSLDPFSEVSDASSSDNLEGRWSSTKSKIQGQNVLHIILTSQSSM